MKIYLRRMRFNHLLLSSLLILATLFALACSKQVEKVQKAETRTNEAAAVRALQNMFRAQTQYSLTHSGDYGTFDQLVTEGLLDRRFAGASPMLEGYVFNMRLVPHAEERSADFSINADPKQAEGTPPPAANARHLYIDSSSNVVHANAAQPATINDAPLPSP
jgi:competence protein ComGC